MADRSISLLWAPRSRCTRGCRYCYFGTLAEHRASPVTEPGRLSHLSENDMPAQDAIAFARSLRGSAVRRVFVAGGEPLAWPPILDVLAALKEADVEVVVCTDGAFLNKPRITAGILDLGIDAVSVSLDSADAAYNDTWRPPLNRRDGWQSVIDGIRALLAARGPARRPRVGLYTVITRLNLADITAVPQLAADLGCDYAVPQPVSLERDHALSGELALTPGNVPQLRSQLARLYAAGLPLGLPELSYPAQVVSAVEQPVGLVRGCFGGRTLYFIEPDGSLWDCPSSLKITATSPERRRSIRGASGSDLFPPPASPAEDCSLFSAQCVCMWPLTGFDDIVAALSHSIETAPRHAAGTARPLPGN
jgi:MoaA/NifB/PqqE/SkfB family radical SAM enzyme